MSVTFAQKWDEIDKIVNPKFKLNQFQIKEQVSENDNREGSSTVIRERKWYSK